MKKILTGLLILGSFSSFADSPFNQFLGEYIVTSENCKSVSSYLENLEMIHIRKGTSFGQNLNDTFIYFKRGGYYSESLNLSAFDRIVDYTADGGATFNARNSKSFTMEMLSDDKFFFSFSALFGESEDDCQYTLELK